MKYADRRGSPCVVIQGGDERAKGEVQIKDLIEGARLVGRDHRQCRLARRPAGAGDGAGGRAGRGGAEDSGGAGGRARAVASERACAPPSVLPDISPSWEEIGRPLSRQPATLRGGGVASTLPISPLRGRCPAGRGGRRRAPSPTRCEGAAHDLPLPRHRPRHPGALRRARRRCGRRAGDPAGRPVPRHGRRGSAPPHLPHRERDRADAVPAGRNSPSPSASTISPAAPTRRAAIPISARCSASAARAATNSSRPASRISARPTPPRPTRARSPTRGAARTDAARTCRLSVTLGDQAVFEAVLAALGLPRGWQKRLARAFGAPDVAGRGPCRPRPAGGRRRARRQRRRTGDGGDRHAARRARRASDGSGRLRRSAAAARRKRSRGGCWRRPSCAACACPTRRFAALKTLPRHPRAARQGRRCAGGLRAEAPGCSSAARSTCFAARAEAIARHGLPVGHDPLRRGLRPAARLLHRPGLRDRRRRGERGRWSAAAATTAC